MPIVRTSLWSKRCACRLLPATRNVIVVSGTADADRALLQAAQAHFADEKDIDFTYWTGIPVDLLCTQASQVPAGSIIQDHWAYITAGAMAR